MITPEEYKSRHNDVLISRYYEEIKNAMLNGSDGFPWICVILEGDAPKEVRDKLAEMILEKGWYCVYHQTSEENGERAGLMEFIICETEEIDFRFRSSHNTTLHKWHRK